MPRESGRRERRITITLTDDEYRRFDAAGHAMSMPPVTWARSVIMRAADEILADRDGDQSR